MPRVHHVKKARKDNPAVKKGEEYFWWKFRYGGKQYSKTRPKASQLTQSNHLSQVYEIEEEIQDFSPSSLEDFEFSLQDWSDRLEELAKEAEESISNMPEQLQDGSVGEMLQERADQTRMMAAEIDSIEVSLERDEESYPEESDQVEAVLDELQAISYEGE